MVDDAKNSVRNAVEAYCNKYCISPAFEISELYDLQTDWTTKDYPFAKECGCYVFYADSDKPLLYIGKASLNDLGSRLSSHFLSDQSRAIPRRSGWTSPPRFMQTIRVHEQYEAPSLEEYLIRRLSPSDNTAARLLYLK
jgi:GIY-YIG catalytic domain